MENIRLKCDDISFTLCKDTSAIGSPATHLLRDKYLAEKRSLQGKCEILRKISQRGALSADEPASRKEVNLFSNSPINFILHKPLVTDIAKTLCCDLMANARD